MKTLSEILAEQQLTTLAAAKAWLQAMGRKLKPYFDDRVIRERTVVSSKLFGWTRGNQILEGLETLAGANAAVGRLVRLLRGDGVDVADDVTVVDQLRAALGAIGVTLSDAEVTALKQYPTIELPNYRLFAPNGQMPSDEEILAALA